MTEIDRLTKALDQRNAARPAHPPRCEDCGRLHIHDFADWLQRRPGDELGCKCGCTACAEAEDLITTFIEPDEPVVTDWDLTLDEPSENP